MARPDLRRSDEMRKVKLTTDVNAYAAASVLAEVGKTQVLCVATVEKGVPDFCREKGIGWIRAEYGMLPNANSKRQARDAERARNEQTGEHIGQALRAMTDLHRLDSVTITIDCDVLQADGNPIGAASAGASAALALALQRRQAKGYIRRMPMQGHLAAMTAAICQEEAVLDPSEKEEAEAQAVFTVWMNEDGEILDLYRSKSGRPVTREELKKLISLCKKGTGKLCREQKKITGEWT